MNLIVIYGPPASGKLTIASALAKKTGYKLFHNHLTIDLLKSIFEYGSPGFFKLNQNMRLDVFEAAAKQNIPGIIFTYVYDKDSDDEFIHEVINRVEKNGGEVKFIQLYCDIGVLLKRVKEESRKQFQKVKSEEGLLNSLSEADQMSSISFVENHKIDSTHLSIEETVKRAVEAIK